MEFYSAISKNEIILYEGKWMELDDIMLSEVSQVRKGKQHMLSLICGRWIQKINIDRKTTMTIHKLLCRIYLY
jgi:hypothetical protein